MHGNRLVALAFRIRHGEILQHQLPAVVDETFGNLAARLQRTLLMLELVDDLLRVHEAPAKLLLQALGNLGVVELLAGDRIDLEQPRVDPRAILILGDVATAMTALAARPD